MSTREKTPLQMFVRGGDVFRHRLSMFWQSAAWVGTIAFVVAGLASWISMYVLSSAPKFHVFRLWFLSKTLSILHLSSVQMFATRVTIGDASSVLNQDQILSLTSPEFWSFGVQFIFSTAVFLTTLVFVSVRGYRFYSGFGKAASTDIYLRGAPLVSGDELKTLMEKEEVKSTYTFAGIPVPTGMEMRNFFATGGMGTGKSVLIFDLLSQVASNNKKMVVWDKTGELTERFYRPGIDYVLSPFDERFPGWNIFSEIEADYEFAQIVHSLIPEAEKEAGSHKFFMDGTRVILETVMRKLHARGDGTTENLERILSNYSLDEFANFCAGTEAAAYLSAAEQASGLISTLKNHVRIFKYVKSGDFSIKEWVRRDDGSRLFINSHENVHDVAQPIVSMYIDIAVRAAMTRDKVREDKLWFFLDELASLKSLPVLRISLTEGRKYGIVHVVGLQNTAQLNEFSGKEAAKTLRSNLQNFMVLRATEEETKKSLSALIGEAEIDEQSEGFSYGAAANRDGSSVQVARKSKALVLPIEIGELRDCEGFLKIAGTWPVAKVRYQPRDYPIIADAFLLRQELAIKGGNAAATKRELDIIEDDEISDDDLPFPISSEQPASNEIF